MFESLFATLVAWGPVGLFFVAIISNAVLFLPTPLNLIIFGVAPIDFFGLGPLSPLVLALIISVGSAIGEMSGYFIGYLGIHTFEGMRKNEVAKLKEVSHRIKESGMYFIAVFSALPLPFDLVGVAAGLVKYSRSKFFFACLVGKSIKFAVICYAGYFGIPFLLKLFGAG
ncbi:MAG: VTT domain-containing protein [archaeon]